MLDQTMLGLMRTGFALPGQDPLLDVPRHAPTPAAAAVALQPAEVSKGHVDGLERLSGQQVRKPWRQEVQDVLVVAHGVGLRP